MAEAGGGFGKRPDRAVGTSRRGEAEAVVPDCAFRGGDGRLHGSRLADQEKAGAEAAGGQDARPGEGGRAKQRGKVRERLGRRRIPGARDGADQGCEGGGADA